MNVVSEEELLCACREGQQLDCMRSDAPGLVDAALLRRCCLELKDQVDPRGIRLQNATIMGCLDLAGMEVPFPLRFEACDFDSAPLLEGAKLHDLALTGCRQVPGLLANGLRIVRDLNLSRSVVTGGHPTSASTNRKSAIWICESDIGGRLLCTDTKIQGDDRERSVQADRMHVGGTVRFIHQFSALGEMRLLGARIDGSLDLTGARISSTRAEDPAIDLGDAVIGGSFILIADKAGRRPVIHGRLDMGSTRISGQFLVRNAIMERSSATPVDSGYSKSRLRGTALSAPRLSVGAELTLEGECEVTGGLDLSMSEMSSLSISKGCSLRADGRTALDLTNSHLMSSLTLDSGVAVNGTLTMTGASVRGELSLQGVTLTDPEPVSPVGADSDIAAGPGSGGRPDGQGGKGYSLVADGIKVGGNMLLGEGFAAVGAVRLPGANITGELNISGARLDGRDESGYALVADGIKVGGNMLLNRVHATAGAVRLPGAEVGRAIACNGARLNGTAQLNATSNDGIALLAGGINASGIYLTDGFTAAGGIWLRSARVRGSVYVAPETPATGATGLDAAHALIAGTLHWTPKEQVTGHVNLQGTAVGQLIDDWSGQRTNGFWPTGGQLLLDGFTYGRLGGARRATVDQRLAWIRSQFQPEAGKAPLPFATQPYEQLAAVYQDAGQDSDARKVAIARRSDLRKYGNLSLHHKLGSWLLDKSIKYGYQTWRAVAGLALLYMTVLAMSILAQHHSLIVPVGNITALHPVPTATRCTSNYPCFYPAGFAIDTVVPIINVHQANYWGLNGSAPWGWAWIACTWIATGLGWALATLLIAGYTGLARHAAT